MRMQTHRKLILSLALLGVALGRTAAQSDTVVRNATVPRYKESPTLVQQVSIGSATGSEDYQFNGITSVLGTKDGNVWVLDFTTPMTASLRIYSAAGKLVRSVGKQGAGNGDYQGPSGLTQLRDGRVALRDVRGNRVNVYKTTGELDTVWTFRDSYTWIVRGRDPIRADTAGFVWLPFTPSAAQQTGPARSVWVRVNEKGAVVDTVWAPLMPDVPRVAITITQGALRSTLAAPFQPFAYVGLSPLGFLVTSVSSRYALDLHVPKAAGDQVTSIRRDVPVVQISDAERQDQKEQLEWEITRRGGTASGPAPEVPAVKPFYTGVSYGEEGRMLVAVSLPSEKYKPVIPEVNAGEAPPRVLSWREPKRSFDVFDPDGSYIGRLDLPASTTPASLRGNTLWATYRDPDGVNYLRRYNVIWR